MTQYRFTQCVAIAKKRFAVGIQEVPTEIEEHPDFLHFVKAGWIHEVDPSELVVKQPRRAEVRGAELAKKLAAKHTKKEPVDVVPERSEKEVQEAAEGEEDELNDTVDDDLTPQQKAARTRKANAEKAKAKSEEGKGEE